MPFPIMFLESLSLREERRNKNVAEIREGRVNTYWALGMCQVF
jgi:hypothetical protein